MAKGEAFTPPQRPECDCGADDAAWTCGAAFASATHSENCASLPIEWACDQFIPCKRWCGKCVARFK